MERYYAKDYRRIAEEKCSPASGNLAVIYLIYFLIILLLSGTSYIGVGAIAAILITGPLALGLVYVTKDLFNSEVPSYQRMFDGFHRFGDAFVLMLLQGIFQFLWSLLFVIPGIVKSYSYAMAFYILDDEEGISANDAITKSREIMDGHKWELFCLELSYIGWLILCTFTLGILSLWVQPKMAAAKYAFYLHITGKDQKVEQAETIE